jgi:hypothetical protein
MGTAVQIGGALLILAAFALVQLGRLSARSLPYVLLNLAGGAVLAVDAFLEEQWGFVLLQTAWTLVALIALAQLAGSARRRRHPNDVSDTVKG